MIELDCIGVLRLVQAYARRRYIILPSACFDSLAVAGVVAILQCRRSRGWCFMVCLTALCKLLCGFHQGDPTTGNVDSMCSDVGSLHHLRTY